MSERSQDDQPLSQSHGQGLQTLFISGYTADVIADRGILHEGVHLLSKPFSTAQLAKAVRDVLQQ